jgi:hypothetical protein
MRRPQNQITRQIVTFGNDYGVFLAGGRRNASDDVGAIHESPLLNTRDRHATNAIVRSYVGAGFKPAQNAPPILHFNNDGMDDGPNRTTSTGV